MKAILTLEITRRTDQKSDRQIVQFTPVFMPDATGTGAIRFATFEAWQDEPETFEAQQKAAMNNAKDCLRKFVGQVMNNE